MEYVRFILTLHLAFMGLMWGLFVVYWGTINLIGKLFGY